MRETRRPRQWPNYARKERIAFKNKGKNGGAYKSLRQQLDKLYRHSRQGSIRTRRRYLAAMDRFLWWLSVEFQVQLISNISNRHLAAYTRYLLDAGYEENYILTELSAIRYFHDQVNGRYRLTHDNSELGVGRRRPPTDRAWTDDQLESVVRAAIQEGKPWIADIVTLGFEQGLRLHEAVRLYRADAEAALRSNSLTVKGKGGKTRIVPLTALAWSVLQRAVKRVDRGARLFVPRNSKAHQVIYEVQHFIRKHRPPGSKITFHGLRYAFAQHKTADLIAEGVDRAEAERIVSKLLGHERQRVTRGYVGPFE